MTTAAPVRVRAEAASTGAPQSRSTRLRFLLGLLVATVALFNARESLGFEFVAFDDDINLVFNPHLGPPSAETLRWMFTDADYMRRYVPFGWLAFSGVYAVSDLSPAGYHALNLALHGLNAGLVFALVAALLRRYGPRRSEALQLTGAAFAAGWWALHPMRAETVGWASGLLYAVAGGLSLGSVLAYLHATSLPSSDARRMRWLVASALAYAMSVFAYPMSLGVMAVFIALDVLECSTGAAAVGARRLAVEKVPLLLPGLASAWIAWVAEKTAPEFWARPLASEHFGLGERLQQAIDAAGSYLWRPWWLGELTPAPTWLFALSERRWIAVVAAAAMIAVTLAFAARRGRRPALLLWLVHFALLAPMLGWTAKPHFANDRYDYLAAVVAAVAVAIAWVRFWPERRVARAAVTLGALALLTMGAHAQREQLRIWRTTDTLLERIVAHADDAGFKAHSYWRWTMAHLGVADDVGAERVVARARRESDPLIAQRAATALEQYRAVLAQHAEAVPLAASLHARLAAEFSRRGRTREAENHFLAALAVAPGFSAAALNYAVFLASTGEPGLAWSVYARQVERAPRTEVPAAARVRFLSVLGSAFDLQGRTRLSVAVLDVALREARSAPDGSTAGAVSVEALNQQRATYVGR